MDSGGHLPNDPIVPLLALANPVSHSTRSPTALSLSNEEASTTTSPAVGSGVRAQGYDRTWARAHDGEQERAPQGLSLIGSHRRAIGARACCRASAWWNDLRSLGGCRDEGRCCEIYGTRRSRRLSSRAGTCSRWQSKMHATVRRSSRRMVSMRPL
jgi:hypothetical protein